MAYDVQQAYFLAMFGICLIHFLAERQMKTLIAPPRSNNICLAAFLKLTNLFLVCSKNV